jgi:hypothetical protein
MRATKVRRPYFIGIVQLDEDGKEEGLMVRRFVLRWYTCRDRNKPSGRAWARALGISHTWLQGLGRRFVANPDEVRRLQAYGDPTSTQLSRAREHTPHMKECGELRLPRRPC